MLELIEIELQRFSFSDFHVAPNIPVSKLKNAFQYFPVPTGEQAIALIDATVFGSAKNGMIFCHSGVYWKNDWTTDSVKDFLKWTEIVDLVGTMTAGGSTLMLAPGCPFNLAGCQVKANALLALFQRIGRGLGAAASVDPKGSPAAELVDAAPPTAAEPLQPRAATSSRPAPPRDNRFSGAYDRAHLAALHAVAKRHRLAKSIYIAPAIQVAKIATILEICGDTIDPYAVLAVVDNTFLQSGKDFLIVTDKELIAKGTLRKVERFSLSEIRRIHCDRSTFYVNNYDFQCFDQLEDSEIVILCDLLIELIPAVQGTGQSDLESALEAVFEESFDQVNSQLHATWGTERDPSAQQQVGKIVAGLFELIGTVCDRIDGASDAGEDYFLHQCLLGYALLAGSAYRKLGALEDEDIRSMLYCGVSLAILEVIAKNGRRRGIYVKADAAYAEAFNGTFSLSVSGADLGLILQRYMNGPPEDRKTALIAQQGINDAHAVMAKLF